MHFVIAGRIDCPQFTYAVMVAQRLKENLPNFTYTKIPKPSDKWEKWLVNTCKENEWYHVKSPLIWREYSLKMGKRQFIGDINKFLDLCYDYYGIPRGVLAADEFKKHEMNWFKSRTEAEYFEDVKLEAKAAREFKSRQVCITGASSQITEILIMEILKIHKQCREGGLEIRLFDDAKKESKLHGSAFDAKHCPGMSGFGNCRVATTLKEALCNVDLVIVLDGFLRKPKESLVKWLKRNRNAMCALGKGLDLYARPHCRVIIGSPSNQPTCYNATVLASFATKLHVRNIVVVTQDLGREILRAISSKTNVPLKDLFCPPVWGFIGLNKYVDVCKTLQANVYKVPGKRKNSTLPQGTEEYELRTLDCLITEEETGEMHTTVSNLKHESYPHLGRWPCLAKATAIVDLLKVWGLKQEDGNGEILCLGVYSDGTFNIPHGLYWSQPVILKNGFWVPFPDFPVPRTYGFNCYYLFLLGLAALYRTKIRPRRDLPPPLMASTKKNRKFDFDDLMKGIDMPVIRTDTESVTYLMYLVKKELGIDFDASNLAFEEESEPEVVAPPEVVVREELYCECWRQELKELQKVVFCRSSSSEVEMNLSDNLSGSEWSVINPNLPVTPETSSADKTDINSFNQKPFLQTFTSSSTVCSCGALSNGSICRCLGDKQSAKSDNISTEHFYKEQNAQIYQDDLTDVIYEDNYTAEKHIQFHPDERESDDKRTGRLPQKFYGRENAIRDEEMDMKMTKRILKYEMDNLEGEKSKSDFSDSSAAAATAAGTQDEELNEAKFHIPIEGTTYDILADPDGLESLEIRRNEADSPSAKSFREMYADKMTSQLHVIPPLLDNSRSESNAPSVAAESNSGYVPYGAFEGEARGEIEVDEDGGRKQGQDRYSDALDAIYDQELYGEGEAECLFAEEEQQTTSTEVDGPSEQQTRKSSEKPKSVKWKSEGIHLCCLCRCVLPEGLPCCPCGSTTVVDVFKKESIEVIVRSEDDLSYKYEYKERFLPPESESMSDVTPVVAREKKKPKDLPPESFFPFSPKLPNEFVENRRPTELTKEYLDSLRKQPEREIPKRCIELLNIAKAKMDEKKSEETEIPNLDLKKEAEERFRETCTTEEPPVKSDFSNVDLFTPDGIEDWRLTMQMKYRKWFYEGSEIRDESYYDAAVEEVSDDETEFDRELEMYFEV